MVEERAQKRSPSFCLNIKNTYGAAGRGSEKRGANWGANWGANRKISLAPNGIRYTEGSVWRTERIYINFQAGKKHGRLSRDAIVQIGRHIHLIFEAVRARWRTTISERTNRRTS